MYAITTRRSNVVSRAPGRRSSLARPASGKISRWSHHSRTRRTADGALRAPALLGDVAIDIVKSGFHRRAQEQLTQGYSLAVPPRRVLPRSGRKPRWLAGSGAGRPRLR